MNLSRSEEKRGKPTTVAIRFGGPPGAGKSTLTRSLKVTRLRSKFRSENQADEGATNPEQRTKGINCQTFTDESSAKFSIFDLGGHGKFLATHQMFIGDGSVPVIDCVVVSALDDSLEADAFKWCSLFASRNLPTSTPWPLVLITTRADKATDKHRLSVLDVFYKIQRTFGDYFRFRWTSRLFIDARKSWSDLTITLRQTLSRLHIELTSEGEFRGPASHLSAHHGPHAGVAKRNVSSCDHQGRVYRVHAASHWNERQGTVRDQQGGTCVSLRQGPPALDRLRHAPFLPPAAGRREWLYRHRSTLASLPHRWSTDGRKTTSRPARPLREWLREEDRCGRCPWDGASFGRDRFRNGQQFRLLPGARPAWKVLNPSKLLGIRPHDLWSRDETMVINAGRRLKCKGTVAIASAFFPHLQVYFYHRYLTKYNEKLPMWNGGVRIVAGEHNPAEALIEAHPANLSIDVIVRGPAGSEGHCSDLLRELTRETQQKAVDISPGSQLSVFYLSRWELDRLSPAGLPTRPRVEYSVERVRQAIRNGSYVSDGNASRREKPEELLLSPQELEQFARLDEPSLVQPGGAFPQAVPNADWMIILLRLAKAVNDFEECTGLAEGLGVNDRGGDIVKQLLAVNPHRCPPEVATEIFSPWLHRGEVQTTELRRSTLHRVFRECLRRLPLCEFLDEELQALAGTTDRAGLEESSW